MDLKILEIASDTKNHKVIKNHTHQSKNKNPLCGDEMEISLIVRQYSSRYRLSVQIMCILSSFC